MAAHGDALPPSTWVELGSLPDPGRVPVFAIAVDPVDDRAVIAGGGQGGLYRSADGGATWTRVQRGNAAVLTIAFSPFNPTLVLAGTRDGGALKSTDGGVTWSPAAGLEGRQVRVFGFAHTMIVAGTDHGVYASDTGATWTSLGLSTSSIDAIAVAAVNPPVRLVAGGESGTSGTVPLWTSTDAGATWTPLKPAISGTIITRIAAGPLPANGNVRPLVLGTNTGLFISQDNGATFTSLSSGALLPSTDYTQVGFTAAHFDRFYVGSDGGGGESGGVWATGDSGQHFSSLRPPLQAVTALAVSGDEQPILYVATFRPSDHAVFLWSYHDTGGTPQQPAGVAPTASGARPHGAQPSGFDLFKWLSSAQAPYIALGVIALAVLVLALVSQIRSRRR
jgi:photosystem II stability/assembly factor-like uncharacterized protein